MNPFVAMDAAAEKDEAGTLPIYKDYAWDFSRNCFRIDYNMKNVIVIENEALKVWIYKTLKTQPNRYRAYESDYGLDLEKYIGAVANDPAAAQTLQADIVAALLVNPYIKSVDNVEATQDGDTITINLSVTTIYGVLSQVVTI